MQNSNLPVHEVRKADWLQLARPFASYVKPRTARRKRLVCQGTAHLRLQLQLLGKPLAEPRVRLRLADSAQAALDTVAALTDAQRRVDIAVPPGTFGAGCGPRRVVRSRSGAGRARGVAAHAAGRARAALTLHTRNQ